MIDKQLQAGLHGDFETACDIGIDLEVERPACHRSAFNRGWYKLMDGDFKGGFADMERGRIEGIFGNPKPQTPMARWGGEELTGEVVLLHGEGGIGDQIINARFTKEIVKKGGRAVMSVSPELMGLMGQQCLADSIVSQDATSQVYHDLWLPAMSAPYVTGIDYDSLDGSTYLTAPQRYIDKHSKYKDLIGARFYGNPEFEHEQYRVFPQELMTHALHGHKWASLQKEDNPDIECWEDTAGIIANLKLVVTSCTAVAHLSAAMGKPTWVIVPLLPYYIWALPGNTSPWYDSVRLFRQTQFNDWTEPFRELNEALQCMN